MSGLLEQMSVRSAERVSAARALRALSDLRKMARDQPPPPALELCREGFDLIAEIKPASPSAGSLIEGPDLTKIITTRAAAYAEAGVAAISVLTEPDRFCGSLEHLEVLRAATDRPLMRKDFLVDPYQVWEARWAGASGILLIVRMLADDRLEEMIEVSREAGLFVLVEAFDEEEMQRAGEVLDRVEGVRALVGLNSRNLQTLEIDSERLRRCAAAFPGGYPKVAESSLETAADAADAARWGYDLALVGTSLMRSDSPKTLAEGMIEAGRAVKRSACTSE